MAGTVPMSPQRVRLRCGSIDTDFHAQTPPQSGSTTPRSTLGSPLTTHAVRRSGVGDLAAGPRRRNSLSEVEVLPWLCCMAPALCIFGHFVVITVSALVSYPVFNVVLVWLTVFATAWVFNSCVASLLGAYKVAHASRQDWHAMLEEVQQVDPDGSSTLHIVILPNYKETERMLKETLENIGRSPMAATHVRVVLAMEAREGHAAQEKAERLIHATAHLFADIFATFHPENLPGEIAGKSSNMQWAYREALRHYGPILLGYDLSRVFLTVGDADTLWHPQYFSALTYQGLMMSAEERVWRIWQPPMLLLRNLHTVPALIRSTAHATLIFELSSLANQLIFPALAFSSYSMTLALASHPEVDGWDADVIAEDHHMFCKCFFAALWELAHAAKDPHKKVLGPIPIEPQVKVEPVFLPAASYLVESANGTWASLLARFQQSRRHSQGVVELGYVLLQYLRLITHAGIRNIPWRTHKVIGQIAAKIHILHITCTMQSYAMVVAALTTWLPCAYRWVTTGTLAELRMVLSQVGERWTGLSISDRLFAVAMSNISVTMVVFSFTAFVVTKNLLLGNYHRVLHPLPRPMPMPSLKEDDEDSEEPPKVQQEPGDSGDSSLDEVDSMPPFVRAMSTWEVMKLGNQVVMDSSLLSYPAIIAYGLCPVLLAAYSLFRRGTDFEYVVAEKPE